MSANIPPSGTNQADNGISQGASARSTSAAAGTSTGSSTRSHEETRSEMRANNGRQSADSLRSDLASLKTELDMLLSRSASMGEQELSEAYARMMTRFSTMRYAARGLAAEATRQLNQGMDRTTDYVKAKPLQSLAIAAGVGLVVGMLSARR